MHICIDCAYVYGVAAQQVDINSRRLVSFAPAIAKLILARLRLRNQFLHITMSVCDVTMLVDFTARD